MERSAPTAVFFKTNHLKQRTGLDICWECVGLKIRPSFQVNTSTITTMTDPNSSETKNISSIVKTWLIPQTSLLAGLWLSIAFIFSPAPADCDVWFYFSHNQSSPGAAELPQITVYATAAGVYPSWPCPRWSDPLCLCQLEQQLPA